jgi:hypothetical protein
MIQSYFLVMMPTWALVPATYAQVDYYVERHGSVAAVAKGNPEREHPDEWRIRLYQAGAPRSGPGWGEIVGQSADDVQEELRRSQVFEERFRKFCERSSHNETSQYANVLGPIAVYQSTMRTEGKPERPSQADAPGPAENENFDVADRVSELEKDFLAVTEEKRVQANPSQYPFAQGSAPWIFATKLAETKKQFERAMAMASSFPQTADARVKTKNALDELESNLLPPMRKALASVTFEGRWKHHGITYLSVRSGRQLSLKADTPEGLRFRNVNLESDTTLSGEIEFIYDNGCEPIWSPFTAELTFDTEAEGILISVPRVGREKSTCRQVTQGTLRMMFWKPEP